MPTDGIHAGDALHLQRDVDDLLDERLFLLLRDRAGLLLERRRPVLGVGRHWRELHVYLLRDGAGPRDLGGDLGDALDLVLVDDRAAGEAPDAAVNDADAEARRTRTAAGAARPPPPPPRPPRPPPKPPNPPPPSAADRSFAAVGVDAEC